MQKAVNSLGSIIENSQKEQADIPCFIIYKVKEILANCRKVRNCLSRYASIRSLYQKILNKYHRYLEMSDELTELNQ